MINPTSSTDFGASARHSEGTAGGITDVVHRPFGTISWSSVFAGAVIALAIQLVLTLIGTAVGLATLNPATGDSPSGTALGFGAGMWLIVTSVISLFLGGYIAARVAGSRNGWLHGLTTWGIVTLLTTILLSTAIGGLVGTASGLTNFANYAGAGPEVRRATRPAAEAQRPPAPGPANPAQADQQARDNAQAAAKGTAAGTGAAALGLILGAVAAVLGGRWAERHLRRYGSTSDSFAPSPATVRQ